MIDMNALQGVREADRISSAFGAGLFVPCQATGGPPPPGCHFIEKIDFNLPLGGQFRPASAVFAAPAMPALASSAAENSIQVSRSSAATSTASNVP